MRNVGYMDIPLEKRLSSNTLDFKRVCVIFRGFKEETVASSGYIFLPLLSLPVSYSGLYTQTSTPRPPSSSLVFVKTHKPKTPIIMVKSVHPSYDTCCQLF